ncbi:MAG TPA: twin transmembrane helix small protein [Steroidobacteraceae bacterium]|nr:twin transmembrane helix small protein [Steroidobacteraceae bacterium]
MLNVLIIVVMIGILVSLGAGLFFLVRDRGRSERTVVSLTIRVALSVLLLVLLAWGFFARSGWRLAVGG